MMTVAIRRKVGGAVVAAVLLTGPALAGCLGAGGPSGAPAPLATTTAGELREYDLYVNEAAQLTPFGGRTVTGFGFSLSPDGPFTIPGPELRIREGDTLRVRLHDNAGFSGHTVHWHGVKLPWAMDGVPYMTQTISAPGQPGVFTYEWTAQESGTYWYHCHVDAPSHIDFGMFGALIIEPRDPAQDPPFARESTLMLHELDSTMFALLDAVFGQPGDLGNLPQNPFDAAEAGTGMARSTVDLAGFVAEALTGAPTSGLTGQGPRDYYPEASVRYRPHYDTFMINGKSFPETEPVLIKSGETIRVRLINAGQLVHTMHLHGTHFQVTHKDGYKLPMAYAADTLLIGPGERYDIYIHGDNPGIWDFHDHGGAWGVGGYTSNQYAFPGGMNTMLVYEDFAYGKLPAPEPGQKRASGDYMVFAPSYQGHRHPRHGAPVPEDAGTSPTSAPAPEAEHQGTSGPEGASAPADVAAQPPGDATQPGAHPRALPRVSLPAPPPLLTLPGVLP